MRRSVTRWMTGIVPACVVLAACAFASAQTAPADLQTKAREAIDAGLKFLQTRMQPNGQWPGDPGVSATCALAVVKSGRNYANAADPLVRKPVEYLLTLRKSDGGIYEGALSNYQTSITLQVLIATKDPKYAEDIRKARAHLLGTQLDEKKGFKSSDVDYGSSSYGDKPKGDLSNTQMWASALHAAEEAGLPKDSEAWKKMTAFVSRCQNRSESNDQAKWAGNDGGYVYAPGESKAGEVTLPDGRKGLRSYASMTYAGLMSMIYADVKKDDDRVKAAYGWVRRNYTLEENPGLGQQGLFYCYHTMAKALRAVGEPTLVDDQGVAHDWRADLIRKLLSLQNPDGSWVNRNMRWWENDPILVTGYALLTLEELLEK